MRLMLAMILFLTSPVVARGQAVQTRAAEILRASGTVEVRSGPQAPWTPVRSGQELRRGDTLRTFAVSVAQLSFTNAVQWQLSAESQLNLEEALAGGSGSIVVRLERGAAVSRWTPDRRKGDAKMIVKTAGGQASITGTEWSMRVDEDGRTALLVLDGSVELSNDRGRVIVHRNEAGEMRPGQAPSLLRLLTPQDRVQWVASYAASPASYATAGATTGHAAEAIDRLERAIANRTADAATYLAAADLLLEAGEFARAGAHAEAGRSKYPANARFDAFLARIALFDDRPAESRAAADRAIAKSPDNVEGWLALGEWGAREGDAPVAWQAFMKATTVDPADARGWFGAGTVSTEREDFPAARRLLQRALAIDPVGPGYRGQVGTLETLANRLSRAAIEYAGALEQRPDDYVALTGRALLALKQAREADALDLLQRATLLEPRYARAQIYLGVAYYRLRRVDDAVKALGRATTLDPRDPLPYLMLTQIYTDIYQPWQAVEAARAAQTRMPFLKSLNQLSNTLKGGANLGNAIAFFGSEAWAEHLAQESYSSSWAGSHLFLGDRYAAPYAKTSEYFQGLLADPTVFGGSPGFQTLLPRQAHYVTVPVQISTQVFDGFDVEDHTVQPEVTINGFANAWRPVAYAVNVLGAQGGSPTADATTTSVVGSAGIRPTPSWSAFVVGGNYNTDFSQPGRLLSAHTKRIDGGAQYHFGTTSTIAFEAGTGSADFRAIDTSASAPFTTGGVPADVEVQHTFSPNPHNQLTWGIEVGGLNDSWNVPIDAIYGVKIPPGVTLDGIVDGRSKVVNVSDRWSASDHLLMQVDLVLTGITEFKETIGHVKDLGSGIVDSTTTSSMKTLPRVGLVARLSPGRLVRVVYQATTSPLGAGSTLAPVATAGVPLDDLFDTQMGDIRRYRGQLEWQWSPRTFSVAFVDHKRFGEITSVRDPYLARIGDDLLRLPLARLRNQLRDVSQMNAASPALLESTVAVPAGSMATVIGLALNHVLSREVSVASQYFWTRSSTLDKGGSPTSVPYYPDQAFSAGITWISPLRVYLSASAMYRTERTSIANSGSSGVILGPREWTIGSGATFAPDWNGTIAASWDTPSRRWSIQLFAADLFTNARLRGVPPHPSVSLTAKVLY